VTGEAIADGRELEDHDRAVVHQRAGAEIAAEPAMAKRHG